MVPASGAVIVDAIRETRREADTDGDGVAELEEVVRDRRGELGDDGTAFFKGKVVEVAIALVIFGLDGRTSKSWLKDDVFLEKVLALLQNLNEIGAVIASTADTAILDPVLSGPEDQEFPFILNDADTWFPLLRMEGPGGDSSHDFNDRRRRRVIRSCRTSRRRHASRGLLGSGGTPDLGSGGTPPRRISGAVLIRLLHE